MDRLQEAVKLAAKYHEESWDESKEEYSMDMHDAADRAAEEVGFDKRGTFPVYIMLDSYWNDTLEWANNEKIE